MIVAAAVLTSVGAALLVYAIASLIDVARRERALSLLRESLEQSFASRERLWAEERRSLLDRIQDPAAVQIARIRSELAEDPEGPSDEDIDEEFAKTPGAAVAWDDDLALLVPGDEEA